MFQIALRSVIVDSWLQIIFDVPLPSDNRDLVISHLYPTVTALLAIYMSRTSIIIDRIPILLQCYRRCMESLASVIPADATYEVIRKTGCITDKIER